MATREPRKGDVVLHNGAKKAVESVNFGQAKLSFFDSEGHLHRATVPTSEVTVVTTYGDLN